MINLKIIVGNNEQKEIVNITRYGYAVNGGTGCR